jgi:hypothetical protein
MENIKFLDATSQGAIEYGYVELEIDNEEFNITIEQYSNGVEVFLLDDSEYKEKLESLGVEFNEDERIIGPDQFLSDLHDFYDSTTARLR